jgi:transposase InsO family protein
MVKDNPTWGAPRIHGELLMLSFDVSERNISRWMKRAPRDTELARRWQAFVRNHRDAIAAMDFFTAPAVVTFQLLYCFFITSHERRQILHVNVTRHPTSTWIAQQLREAFPYESAPKFLPFDNDQKYGVEVPAALRSLQITAVLTSIQSPWQNGVAERRVGSCRRDLLDHIIALNERHLKRLQVLLSRRPHPSWSPQGNSWPQNPFCSHRSGDLPCAIGRFAPSLRPRGLRCADFHWLTPLGTSVGSSAINEDQMAPTQHLHPRTQPISCRKTSSGPPSRCTLNFGELDLSIGVLQFRKS